MKTKLLFPPLCLLILLGIALFAGKPSQSVQAASPSYILEEDFEGVFPPSDWEVKDNAGSGKMWQRNDARGVPNYCSSGNGYAAVAHPGDTNISNWDTELISPPIDLTGASTATLDYASHFQDYAGNGEIWLDITTDGGANWTNLRNQTSDDPPGGTPAVGGTLETVSLSPFSGNEIRLRWRFQANNTAAWMWHIDAVKVSVVGGGSIPGTSDQPLKESFEGTFPPTDWAVIDNAGAGEIWQRNDDRGVPNYCSSGSGYAAVAHPGDTNTATWDTELRSPPIDLTKAIQATVQYASHFQDYAGNGEIWLDISIDGGATWANLRTQTSDDPPGGVPIVGGTLEIEDLSAYIGEVIVLRWRFQASNTAAWMWHMDEVVIDTFTPAPPEINLFSANTFPTHNATLAKGITHLTLEFNMDVKGSANTESANNIVNYLLFGAGSNDIFDTVDCAAGVSPSDVNVPIFAASYDDHEDAGPYVVSLAINNDVPLPAGKYRLLACGTTSIENNLNLKLNDGADTILDFTVQGSSISDGNNNANITLPKTGFAPGAALTLPQHPATAQYAETPITLSIPKLDLSMPIVGIPEIPTGWDVTWLGNKVGYLAGSAYPTWIGNTVLTGHVWDAFNNPGPFAQLKTLHYGDQVMLLVGEKTYIYEVRDTRLISPIDVDAMLQHEEYDWITLVTCEDYNTLGATYDYRRMVRAVLVDVR